MVIDIANYKLDLMYNIDMGNQKLIGNLELQQKALSLDKQKNESANTFNKIIGVVNKNLIHFYERISLISAGAISLAMTALIAINNSSSNSIESYKWLLIIGLFMLFISLVSGIFYIRVNADTNFYSAKTEWGKNFIECQDFYDSIPPQTTETIINDKFRTKVKNEDKKVKALSILQRIIKTLCPLSFVLGLMLVSGYFLAQIFNF